MSAGLEECEDNACTGCAWCDAQGTTAPRGTLQVGDRVRTPYGVGSIVYWRMAPPTYTEVDAYSVRLDSQQHRIGYAGTIVRAAVCVPEVSP